MATGLQVFKCFGLDWPLNTPLSRSLILTVLTLTYLGLCTTIGMIAQFFLVGSAAWNFAISAILLRMLLAYKIDTLEWEVKYHHMFCWGTATVCTFVPLFAQAYGYTPNIEIKYGFVEFECWIEEPSFQMCLYGPAMAFVFFAACLLIFTLYRSHTGAFHDSNTV